MQFDLMQIFLYLCCINAWLLDERCNNRDVTKKEQPS